MSTHSPDPASAPSPERAESPVEEGAPVARVRDLADESRIRRAPRYGRFALLGLILGAVVSLALTFVPVPNPELTRSDLFFLLLIGLGPAGIFAGLAGALLADRRSLRRRGRR